MGHHLGIFIISIIAGMALAFAMGIAVWFFLEWIPNKYKALRGKTWAGS